MVEKFQPVYVAERVLGEGAFGKVYLVHNQRAEDFALKVLKAKSGEDLSREARLLLRVSHPNLPALHEFFPQVQDIQGVEEKGPALLIEFIEGSHPLELETKPKFEEIERYFVQGLRALAYLHGRRMVHGDIKPANLRISKKRVLKILDFGLAALAGETGEEVRGTLDYLAPEAISGKRGPGSDLFSLAVVFYQWLTGRLPYDAALDLNLRYQTPPAALPNEKSGGPPAYFAALLTRLLQPDPVRRVSSALAALRSLNQNLKKPYPLEDSADAAAETMTPWVGREGFGEAMAGFLNAWEAGSPRTLSFVLRGRSGTGRRRSLQEWQWQAKFRDLKTRHVGGVDWSSGIPKDLAGNEREILILSDLQLVSEADLEKLFRLLHQRQVHAPQSALVLEFNEDLAGPALRQAVAALSAEQQVDWSLEAFSLAETQAYLAERFFSASIDPGVAGALHGFSGGLPRWLDFIAETLQKRGGLPASLRELSLRELENFSYPETSRAALRQRWREISAPSRQILGALAMLRQALPAKFFARVSERGAPPAAELLQELRERGFARESGGAWELSPPALALKLLEFLNPEERKNLAERCYQALRAEHPAETLGLAELAKEAGLNQEFRSYGMRAAEQLAQGGQAGEAIRLYRELLAQCPEREDQKLFYAHLASLYGRLARFDEALDAYDRWYRHADDDGSGLRELKYHYLTGLVFYNRGDRKKSRERLQKALSLGNPNAPEHRPLHQKVLALLGKLFERDEKWEQARESYDRGLALGAEPSQERAELLRHLGSLAQARHDPEAAERFFLDSLKSSEALGYEDGMANAAYLLAGLKQHRQQYESALSFYSQALGIAERRRDPLKMGRIHSNMAAALIEIADYGHAYEHIEKAMALLSGAGHAEDRWLTRFQRATLQTYLGQGNAAFDPELQSELAPLQRKDLAPHLRQLQGESLRLQRDFKGALQSYRQARQGFLQADRAADADECLLREILTECLAGDVEAGQKKLEEVKGEITPFFGITRDLLTLAPDAGLARLQQCANAVFKSAQQEWVLLILRGIAEVRARASDAEGAEFLRQKAYEWLSGLYRALPEEMRLNFENREDFQKLAEADLKRQAASGISRERFLTFARINQRLNAEPDMHAIVEQVMDAAMALAGAERGFLLISDTQSNAQVLPGFRVETARNMKKENIGREEFKISLSVVEEALRRRVPILTDDARADPQFRQAESVHLYQLKSILVLPLVSDRGCLGALYLDHRFEVGAFNDEGLMFLKAFADQSVLAIEKARTLGELARAKRALEKRVVQQAQQIEQMEFELKEARKELKYGYEEIIGQSPKMIKILQLLDRVTETRIPIWVHGESGTGKELIARALHYNSDRKAKPFIAENCSAIPENLLESVLFGHVRGAFTHAEKDRMGLFEAANGGTIFLDEIGDMPLPMQAKLLRVLQEGEVRRVGSHQAIKVDVRVVSATNKNLPVLVKSGEFREDLFFRLNGLKIELPPLRERKEDIPLLMQHFLEKVAEENGMKNCAINREALTVLANYDWPGNIRELQNAARNALLFSEGRTITPEMLGFKPELFLPSRVGARHAVPLRGGGEARSTNPEREAILDALVRANFHKGEAAEELKVTARHLYNLLEKYELPKNKWALKKLVEEERH